jgi:hypothetical protein
VYGLSLQESVPAINQLAEVKMSISLLLVNSVRRVSQ